MGPKRRANPKCYFEPMYNESPEDPYAHDSYQDAVWDFSSTKGPCRMTFSADQLSKPEPGKSIYKRFPGITFIECDFRGVFSDWIVHFDGCHFDRCDFATSNFVNAKFTGCTFEKTSFTLTKFLNCQLREFKFSEIGISGNETQFLSSDLTNPNAFIAAASTNLTKLPTGVRPAYQKNRLALTKGTLSKVILHNLAKEGADSSYYDAVKSAQLHGALADSAAAILAMPDFDQDQGRKPLNKFGQFFQSAKAKANYRTAISEYWILLLVGSMNGWGRSISRIFLIGFILALMLSIVRYVALNIGAFEALIQTSEIFLVFGYTKYSLASDGALKSIMDLLTAMGGLGWYAVAAATVISKVTKVRG